MLVINVFALFDIYYAYVLSVSGVVPKLLFWFIIVLFVLVAMWMNYFFPYIARFENTTRQILKVTVILILMLPLLIFVLPVLYMVLTSMNLERVFRKYMTLEDIKLEDQRNGDYYE